MSDLPPGWEWATLGEICERPQYGWTTRAERSVKGPRLLRTTDISRGFIDWLSVPGCRDIPEDTEKYCLASGDIVVSRAGSVGLSCLVDSPPLAVFASYLIRLRPVIVDPKYLALFLKSPGYWTQIEDATDGIAIPNINARKLEQIRIPVPSLTEQRRIVSALEDHLSRLDAARRYVVHCVERLPSLRAAALANARDVAVREAVTSRTIGEISETQLGKMLDAKRSAGTPTEYLRNINVRWQSIGLADLQQVSLTQNERAKFGLEPGDILVCEGGEPGRCAVWRGQHSRLAFQKALHRVRVCGDVLPEWLSLMLEHAVRSGHINHLLTGSTIKHLPQDKLRSITIPLPERGRQQALVEHLEKTEDARRRLDDELSAAATRSGVLRRSLLAEAFAGRLVPQDPNYEPASVLLERIRAERGAQPKSKHTRRAKKTQETRL